MSLTDMAGIVSTKGQVTIPQPIRERLGIHPGAVVEFKVSGESIVVRKRPGEGRGAAIVERMRGTATTGLSTEQIMALTRR
jgi:AbrB family looped-hinge helix DNA binding protein